MDNDIIFEERSVYTFWDLLGDIGGLIGSLSFLGAIHLSFVEFIIGSRMNQFITAQMFKIGRKQTGQQFNLNIDNVLRNIKKRKVAEFQMSGWLLVCCDRKKQRLQAMAEDRTAKHVDVVNLIRSQLIEQV